MEELVKNRGINSFKMFMTYKGVFMLNDDEIYKVCKRSRELGALAMMHAENGDVLANVSLIIINRMTLF